MAKLSRFIDLAAKALDKGTSSQTPSQGSGDWRSMVRGVADAVTGDSRAAQGSSYPAQQQYPAPPAPPAYGAPAASIGLTPPPAHSSAPPAASRPGMAPPTQDAADRAAIARYEYLLQTADPHQVEQIHREAFARLTPAQRAQVQARMQTELRPGEQPRTADPADLARSAARSEAMRPGIMSGLLARAGAIGGARSAGGRGGSMVRGAALVGAGGLLGAVAGGAIATAVAGPLLAQAVGMGIDFDALAGAVDLEGIAGVDLEGLAGDALGGVGDQIAGAGDMVSGFGDQLSNFELPGLGDLF